MIKVGGLRAFPEEIEAVIHNNPGARMSRVLARRSPIRCAVVAAEVALAGSQDSEAAAKADLAACRQRLAKLKVPAQARSTQSVPMTAASKLERTVA